MHVFRSFPWSCSDSDNFSREPISKTCAYGTCGGSMEGNTDRQNEKQICRYEKLSEKILLWEDKKKKKAKRKLHRTERGVEKTKMKAMQRFRDENESIEIIVASARAHAYESRMKQELKVKEKANLMRTTGQNPSACLC